MKKIFSKIVLFSAISSIILTMTPLVWAVSGDLIEGTFDVSDVLNLDDGQEQSYFNDSAPIISFILSVIQFATLIIGSIAMIIMIIGGFMMVIAQGNQQKIDDSKEVLKYAIIGLVVTFLSYIIVIFVQSLFIGAEAS